MSVSNVVQFEGENVRSITRGDPRRLFHEIRAKDFAAKLVPAGAIMTIPGPPASRQLVGDLSWENDGRLLWFVAFGDLPSDARSVDFDETHVVDRLGIYFLRGGMVAAYLSTIDAAGVDDPEDYHTAWRFWQQVAPLRRPFIERSYDSLRSRENSHGVDAIDGSYSPAATASLRWSKTKSARF